MAAKADSDDVVAGRLASLNGLLAGSKSDNQPKGGDDRPNP